MKNIHQDGSGESHRSESESAVSIQNFAVEQHQDNINITSKQSPQSSSKKASSSFVKYCSKSTTKESYFSPNIRAKHQGRKVAERSFLLPIVYLLSENLQ